MDIRFLTTNPFKEAEFQALFHGTPHKIVANGASVDEIQTENMEKLVRDKVLKAFDAVRRPIFVDHTGLYFELLNGFPGGLTQIFWDHLKADAVAKLIGRSEKPAVRAVTLIGYCDGRSIHVFKGEVHGTVPVEPRGSRKFQWDCVFVPGGYSETFAELGDKKNEISMRRRAVDAFIKYLGEADGVSKD